MNQKLPKILFFGTEDYSLITLKALVESGFEIEAVITKPDAPRGRGQKLAQPPVKEYAIEHGIDVWQPTKLSEIHQKITQLQPVVGVLVAYGKIIPQPIIDLFSPGIINLHPSLLPKWRGPSPIEAAIANCDHQTGVSIMKLDAKMDAGPVYVQISIDLDKTETKPELYAKLFDLGSRLLVDSLPKIISGELQPTPQYEAEATYCQLLSKDNSLIDQLKLTAKQADAHVRAHLSFPRSKITLHGRDLIVTKTHIANNQESPLSVKCSDDLWLVIDELIAPSGKIISSEDYLRGYPIAD